jgi:hypothetical protein
MITFIRKNLQSILFSLIGMTLLVYLAIKAGTTSFTHDESYTYLQYIHQSFMEIISFSDWYTNNHILNSLFMKYAEQLFGNSELALRLPNLLVLVVYMVYCYRLLNNTSIPFASALFVLLCTNPLVVSMFGLARGYGLSYGFMMMGLYHYIMHMKEDKKRDLYLFHFAAVLATLSHFSLLLFYVALMMIYYPIKSLYNQRIMNKKYSLLDAIKVNLLPFIISAIILYEPVRRVMSHSPLDNGGKIGLYPDTVNIFILDILHVSDITPSLMIVLKIAFTLVPLISLLIIIQNAVKKNRMFFTQFMNLICITFLMLLIPVIMVLQHVILGSDYPIGRFSAFLIPLWIIQLGFLLQFLMSKGYRTVVVSFVSGLALISLLSFGVRIDSHSCGEWGYDAETKNMIVDLQAEQKSRNSDSTKIKLGVNWLFEPTANFYRKTKRLNWLLPVDRKNITKTEDYFYIFKQELDSLKNSEYVIIKEYPATNTLLIKNKNDH